MRCEIPQMRKEKIPHQPSSASSLTDSLRSVVRLRRAVSAHSKAVIRLSTESGDNAGKNM
uniref:Alpha-hemolysin n=1 Tax=Aeromonas hydrophila TaxID=644 RepID=Q44068_AERHY|nr:alpha-hemolysin [Aeromonas hydrophila]